MLPSLTGDGAMLEATRAEGRGHVAQRNTSSRAANSFRAVIGAAREIGGDDAVAR